MIYDYLVSLVGTVPEGYEPVVYVISCLVCFFLLCEFFAFFHSIISRIAEG